MPTVVQVLQVVLAAPASLLLPSYTVQASLAALADASLAARNRCIYSSSTSPTRVMSFRVQSPPPPPLPYLPITLFENITAIKIAAGAEWLLVCTSIDSVVLLWSERRLSDNAGLTVSRVGWDQEDGWIQRGEGE